MKNAELRQKYENDDDFEYAKKIRNLIKAGKIPRYISDGFTINCQKVKKVIDEKTMKQVKHIWGTKGNRKLLCAIDVFVQGRKMEANNG